MTGEVFIFLCLGGLALFILWEGWQGRRAAKTPLPRSEMEQGINPGASSQELALFVSAVAGFVFGFTLIVEPSHPPFSGRGAVVDSVLFQVFGIWGKPLVCWVLALIACMAAVKLRRKRLKR
jgi:hypothetical protein